MEKHIDYEEQSYILSEIVKNKFNKDKFIEKDFLDISKNINEKTLGLYFKCRFLNDYNLPPIEEKIQFKKIP